jgi:hypothetical protein
LNGNSQHIISENMPMPGTAPPVPGTPGTPNSTTKAKVNIFETLRDLNLKNLNCF